VTIGDITNSQFTGTATSTETTQPVYSFSYGIRAEGEAGTSIASTNGINSSTFSATSNVSTTALQGNSIMATALDAVSSVSNSFIKMGYISNSTFTYNANGANSQGSGLFVQANSPDHQATVSIGYINNSQFAEGDDSDTTSGYGLHVIADRDIKIGNIIGNGTDHSKFSGIGSSQGYGFSANSSFGTVTIGDNSSSGGISGYTFTGTGTDVSHSIDLNGTSVQVGSKTYNYSYPDNSGEKLYNDLFGTNTLHNQVCVHNQCYPVIPEK
jgi:hypothetical protein